MELTKEEKQFLLMTLQQLQIAPASEQATSIVAVVQSIMKKLQGKEE